MHYSIQLNILHYKLWFDILFNTIIGILFNDISDLFFVSRVEIQLLYIYNVALTPIVQIIFLGVNSRVTYFKRRVLALISKGFL